MTWGDKGGVVAIVIAFGVVIWFCVCLIAWACNC